MNSQEPTRESPVQVGVCALCDKTRPLGNSHVIPQGAYARLHGGTRLTVYIAKANAFLTEKQARCRLRGTSLASSIQETQTNIETLEATSILPLRHSTRKLQCCSAERVQRFCPSVSPGPQRERQAGQHGPHRLLRDGLARYWHYFQQQSVQQLHGASASARGAGCAEQRLEAGSVLAIPLLLSYVFAF
jgi:hypothetical protein